MSALNPVNKANSIHRLCEANFLKLLRLAPRLDEIKKQAIAYAGNKPALYLRVIERNPYTLTLELSHCFEEDMQDFFEPAVIIRAYLDARTAEVLQDSVRPEVRHALNESDQYQEVLDYKWSLNYFLEKWLNHCLDLGYRFEAQQRPIEKMNDVTA